MARAGGRRPSTCAAGSGRPGTLSGMQRCRWVPPDDALYCAYHDTEWGWPQGEDDRLFEKLVLEGFQAGLSWRTVLAKRPAFRAAFAGFAIDDVAAFGPADVARMLADPGLIRHRGKIGAAVGNARVAQALQREAGSLAACLWRYEHEPAGPRTTSARATDLAADLRRRGWRFLGPTSAYAFAQSVGLVADHERGCAVRPRVAAARAAFAVPGPQTGGGA
jgi:DNA-3-methyladenine glycosylase I